MKRAEQCKGHVQDQMGKDNDKWVSRINEKIHQEIGDDYFYNGATSNSISFVVVGNLTLGEVWQLIYLIQEVREFRMLIDKTKIPYGTNVIVKSSPNRVLSDEAKRLAALYNAGIIELQIELSV